jgi:hypothetical protein
MAGVTQNVASYLGELFQSSKRPNTLLRMIGYFAGQVIETKSKEFPIGVYYSLRSPAQPAVLEGANAPTASSRTVTQTTNVVQIHQEAVSLTYLSQSDQTVSGVIAIPQGAANGEVVNPRSQEFQVKTAIDTVAQDVNYSFWNGVFANPADPSSTAMKTRGILTAITTNSMDQSADTGVDTTKYRGYVESLMRLIVISTGYNPDLTWTIAAGTTEFSNICAAYEAKGTIYLQPESEVGGIKIRKILTRYGTLNLVLDPDIPNQYFAIVNMGVVAPVGLPVPGKGILFEEALAKSGSADLSQIYGQIGIDHAPEFMHGKCKVPSGVSL